MTLPTAPWDALLLGAALAAPLGFLAGRRALVARLRARERALREECAAVALLAAEAGDHPRALAWFRHARALAPRDAALARQEAWCLAECGRTEEALDAYARASALSQDGLADFDAALLVLANGLDPARAEAHALEALRRTPLLALEAEGMEEFQGLLARPAFKEAMARALEGLREPPS